MVRLGFQIAAFVFARLLDRGSGGRFGFDELGVVGTNGAALDADGEVIGAAVTQPLEKKRRN